MKRLLIPLLASLLLLGCTTCPKLSDVYTNYTTQTTMEATKVVTNTIEKELAEFKPKILSIEIGFHKNYGSCTALVLMEGVVPAAGFHMKVKQIVAIELQLDNKKKWKPVKAKAYPISVEKFSEASS